VSALVLDGRPVARAIRGRLAQRVAVLRARGIAPCLAVVLVGDDPASLVYVGQKEKACREVGIESRVLRLPASSSAPAVLSAVEGLGADAAVHGIIVQQPLPGHLDASAAVGAVPPGKDVDGLHPYNAGRLMRSEPGFVSCTPRGVMALLEAYDIRVAGRTAVVVGRSTLVGRPMGMLLLAADATVAFCHSRTANLGEWTRRADVLVVAAGRPALVRPDMVRPGAAVVDVGISRIDGRLQGDVDPAVAEVAGALSPVPGGVGPLTVAMLLDNTVQAAEACS
jgi:methylenetetrahydrofolate dehydrogenase (NADP+)/methenyltetrahydrofolate cyclohydrolase